MVYDVKWDVEKWDVSAWAMISPLLHGTCQLPPKGARWGPERRVPADGCMDVCVLPSTCAGVHRCR